MATVSTRHCFSQSVNSCRSCVKVGNDRTESLSRSAGTATKISVAPTSIPPAFGLISGRLRSNLRCFLLFGLAMARLRFLNYGNVPGVQDMEISQAGSSQPKNVARHLCYCARAWDQTPQRARQSKHQWGTRSTLIALSLIHISEPTRQAEISYAVFCLKKKKNILPLMLYARITQPRHTT